MNMTIKPIILLFILLLTNIIVYAEENWSQERWYFKKSYKALLNKDLETFEYLLTQLSSYPITHYLRYFYLRQYLDKENPDTIQAFLYQYNNSAATPPLQRAWLRKLAKQKDWETFMAVYTPQKSAFFQCYYLQAHLDTNGQLKDALIKQAKKLWSVGKSQPRACDSIFNYLYQNQLITNTERWQRIRLVMKRNKIGLARFLGSQLAETDRQLLDQWLLLHSDPAYTLKKFKHPDTSLAREMVLHGIKRLAKEDVEGAYSFWQSYQQHYQFALEEKRDLLRYIALKAVSQNHPNALTWLNEIKASWSNERINQAKLKLALLAEDWKRIIQLAQNLYPIDQENKYQWQYWKARALEQLGRTSEAEQEFSILSKQRDYYGFLAAHAIGEAYSFQKNPIRVSNQQKQQLLKKYPKLVIARELHLTGWSAFARSEWNKVLSKLSNEEIKIAAKLMHEWKWYHKTISTLHKIKNYDDLDMRFPIPFYSIVLTEAENKQLSFAYIYAIMRKESAFQIDAHSSAGALGLMQLMPSTAKEVAKKQGIKLHNKYSILEPETNIQLGSYYLRQMLDRFDNNHLLATAAYNAGPSRAKRWREQYGCFPPDIWIELIPFTQTRDYVKTVLSYTLVFDFQVVGQDNIKPMLLDTISPETDECSNN